MMARKADAVDRALALHGSHRDDPFEVLRRVGGREFAAIAGAIIAARVEKVPVILDGFAASPAAAVFHAVNPRSIIACLPICRPIRACAGRERLGLRRFSISAGPRRRRGAALAAGIVKAAALSLSGMAAAAAEPTLFLVCPSGDEKPAQTCASRALPLFRAVCIRNATR